MSKTEVDITCPHCRREYHLSLDLDKLTRVKTRAVCSRCSKSFDVGSRVPALTGSREADIVEIVSPAGGEPQRELPGRARQPEVEHEPAPPKKKLVPDIPIAPRVTLKKNPKPAPEPEPEPARVQDPPAPAPPSPVSAEGDAVPESELEPELEPRPEPEPEPELEPGALLLPDDSWLEMADTGIAGLESAPAEGALALERLINQAPATD